MKKFAIALLLALGTGDLCAQYRNVVPTVNDSPVTSANRLPVTCDNCGNGTGGVGAADSSTFTAGSSVFAAIGGVYNDALTAVTSTKWATARITAYRAEHVNLRDNSGNEIGVSSAPMYVQFGTAQHIVCDSGCGSASSVLMADATPNPTIPQAASFGMLYNGTGWDRWRGDATSGAWMNIKNASIAVTGTFWQATQPVSGTITANAGTNLNTSALALEAGGHLASVDTNTTGAAKDATLAETHAAVAATMPSKDSVVGGSDYGGTPHVQTIKIDSSGNIYAILGTSTAVIGHIVVDSVTGTVTIAGTVTANIGTTNGLALDATLTGGGLKAQIVNGGNVAGVNASGQVAIQNEPNLDAALSTRATESTLALVKAKTDNLDVLLSSRTKPADQQHALLDSGSTTTVTQATGTNLHAVVDSAPTTAVTNAGLSNIPADPAREGGNLASVKTNTDPLVASGAGGYVRQDSTATIAKENGGNLATIATNVATSANQTNGNQKTQLVGSTTASVTVVVSSQLDTTLLAASATRKAWNVCNSSQDLMLLKLGSGASAWSYTVKLPPSGCYGQTDVAYNGQINAVFYPGGNGQAVITELQP